MLGDELMNKLNQTDLLFYIFVFCIIVSKIKTNPFNA